MRRRPAYHRLTRPSPKVSTYLGELEAEIMELLWSRDGATPREVFDALGRPLAYTTVITVMTRLVDKGLLAREAEGPTHRYKSRHSRDEFLSGASRQVIADLVTDFGDVAIVHFLRELDKIDPQRLQQLRKLAGGDDER
jgi:predicted transcriptional regulator